VTRKRDGRQYRIGGVREFAVITDLGRYVFHGYIVASEFSLLGSHAELWMHGAENKVVGQYRPDCTCVCSIPLTDGEESDASHSRSRQ
jgi:hypothetical protein